MNPSSPNSREARGLAIVSAGAAIVKEGKTTWHVPSQSKPGLSYTVQRWAVHGLHEMQHGRVRWTCNCPDHQVRAVECKHIHAAKFTEAARKSLQMALPGAMPKKPRKVKATRGFSATLPEDTPPEFIACKHCDSTDVVKNGVQNGKQSYRCRAPECARKFVPDEGFARLKGEPKVVCLALDLHFKGNSLRQITDTLNQFFGLRVAHATVYRWIVRYVGLINEYAATLEPCVGDKWHADEVFTKFSGKLEYLWHVMDADTRYLLVSRVTAQRNDKDALRVMRDAAALAGKSPDEIVTDGLPAYVHAVRSQLRGAKHTREIHISKPQKFPHNNKVERLNGTVRQRQKVARGLKKPSGPLTAGQAAYYNHIRPHQSLGGRTPAEAAGVAIARTGDESTWASLIRKAARRESVTG